MGTFEQAIWVRFKQKGQVMARRSFFGFFLLSKEGPIGIAGSSHTQLRRVVVSREKGLNQYDFEESIRTCITAEELSCSITNQASVM